MMKAKKKIKESVMRVYQIANHLNTTDDVVYYKDDYYDSVGSDLTSKFDAIYTEYTFRREEKVKFVSK